MTQKEILSSLKDLNANKDSTTWDQRTFQRAPHKPFLLLSILDGIEIGWIDDPRITLTQDLIETFFRYWNRIMGEDRKTTIALPFFHMKSEPFWDLHYREGMTPYSNSPSLGGLMKRLSHARMDDQLFAMMQDEEGQQRISSTIIRHYFSEDLREEIQSIHRINIGAYRYAEQLELLAAEPFEKYHTDDNAPSYSWQKKQQRKQGFRINVRQNYTHRCAICRAKVQTPSGKSLVEGAHIIPWNRSKNDDPRNGLALCKTHHWMFDKQLLSIRPDYQIKLSAWLKNRGENIDDTLAWDREQILLPDKQQFLPSQEALEERYEEFKTGR
ncbi:HNH endonuclease [Fodinibius halophilus]|uniref:HNH nuclease domain-containing protein n=1 Tax=Fodinibius halophilus TaxID=1736908 RepID=A0A6M1TGG2_9BACT|nr:HNH endonuclease [Fodinibius halophilus]NGP89192.1 hypothetical protein [Fodinibius halophilus]